MKCRDQVCVECELRTVTWLPDVMLFSTVATVFRCPSKTFPCRVKLTISVRGYWRVDKQMLQSVHTHGREIGWEKTLQVQRPRTLTFRIRIRCRKQRISLIRVFLLELLHRTSRVYLLVLNLSEWKQTARSYPRHELYYCLQGATHYASRMLEQLQSEQRWRHNLRKPSIEER